MNNGILQSPPSSITGPYQLFIRVRRMGIKEAIRTLWHKLFPHRSSSSEHAHDDSEHEVPPLHPQNSHSHKQHPQEDNTPPENNDEGIYRSMSEVAAPGPAEKRKPEEESSRRPSLERTYSNTASRRNGRHQEDKDKPGSLSELAAPEPVGKGREGSGDGSRRDSLERRLSGSSG